MSERSDANGGDAAVLRDELSRVRQEAGRALAQLRHELDHLRESQDSMRDVDSVTEQIAMQQELDTMRNTLHDKERMVDSTAVQCQRLEDELEDQHLAYEGLKQDLERKMRSLAEARDQAERMTQERHEIEARYQALVTAGRHSVSASDVSERSSARSSASTRRFAGGLFAGALLAAVGVAVWILLGSPRGEEAHAPDSPGGEPALTSAPDTVPDEPAVFAPKAGDAGEQLPRPETLSTLTDLLSDGSAGPPMVALNGGAFVMGKLRALPSDDAGPAHEVRLGGFLIGVTEVTFEEYDRFVRDTGRRSPDDFGWGRGRRPVGDVSWDDARAYAEWLSRRTGKRYRLPSEAEWEYAAAAGKRTTYWWGFEAGSGRAVCFDCGSRWDGLSSAPVASFGPNPLGLHDTAGNLMEWVEDCYHPNYIGAPLDGRARGGVICRFRVARGGAFNKPARSMRATARHHFAPETRIDYLGFRLARDEG